MSAITTEATYAVTEQSYHYHHHSIMNTAILQAQWTDHNTAPDTEYPKCVCIL